MTIKTLAMLKMEKNFTAHIKKKYPRQPYLHYDLDFWLSRIMEETLELKETILRQKLSRARKNYQATREELADISNLVDYAFERTFIEED